MRNEYKSKVGKLREKKDVFSIVDNINVMRNNNN
jgi:hypothetical protein